MGAGLYSDLPVYRAGFDHCAALFLNRAGIDIRPFLALKGEPQEAMAARLASPRAGMAALFSVEYALAGQLRAWEIAPDSLIGHSLGEYVAATLAGVFSLETTVHLVAVHAALIERTEAGAMMMVPLSEREAAPYLEARYAFHHGRAHTGLVTLARRLAESGRSRPLRIVVAARGLARVLGDEPLGPCRVIPFELPEVVCTAVDAAWNEPDERVAEALARGVVTDSGADGPLSLVAVRHDRLWVMDTAPVDLPTAVTDDAPPAPLVKPGGTYLILGGGGGLGLSLARHLANKARTLLTPGRAAEAPIRLLLVQRSPIADPTAADSLRALGAMLADLRRRRAEATAPFERADLTGADGARPDLATPFAPPRHDLDRCLLDILESRLGIAGIGIHDDYVELGGDSLLAMPLTAQIRDSLAVPFPVATLFRTRTAARIADHLLEVESGGARLPTLAGVLQRVKAMTPDQVSAALVASDVASDASSHQGSLR